MDVSEMPDVERFALAKQLATDLRGGLVSELDMAGFTLKSKLPWKACALREALSHRMSDISDVALDLYDADRRVAAFIQTRAAVETVAMLFWLEKKCRNFLTNWDIDAFDEFLMKAIMGSRDGSTTVTSLQILDAVDNLSKEYRGFRKMYDSLCEYTHPNWSGVLGAYSVIDPENWKNRFGRDLREQPLAFGLGPLIGSLSVFIHHYNEMETTLDIMDKRFEELGDS